MTTVAVPPPGLSFISTHTHSPLTDNYEVSCLVCITTYRFAVYVAIESFVFLLHCSFISVTCVFFVVVKRV